MAFLDKLIEEGQERKKKKIELIAEEIEILFSNRHDKYWAYNFKTGEIVGIHEIFKEEKPSREFTSKLKEGIEAYEPRIEEVEIEVEREEMALKIKIKGKIKGEEKGNNEFAPLEYILKNE